MRVISSVSLWKNQKVLFDSGSPHAITWRGSLQWAIFLQTDLRKNYSAEVPFRYIETFYVFWYIETCFLKAKQACAVILKSSSILIRASLEMSDSGSWGSRWRVTCFAQTWLWLTEAELPWLGSHTGVVLTVQKVAIALLSDGHKESHGASVLLRSKWSKEQSSDVEVPWRVGGLQSM